MSFLFIDVIKCGKCTCRLEVIVNFKAVYKLTLAVTSYVHDYFKNVANTKIIK